MSIKIFSPLYNTMFIFTQCNGFNLDHWDKKLKLNKLNSLLSKGKNQYDYCYMM